MRNERMMVAMALVLALAVGCSKSDSADKTDAGITVNTEKEYSLSKLPDDAVLAQVNGRKLTKARYIGYQKMHTAFFCYMKPDAKPEEIVKVKKNAESSCLPTFIQNTIIFDAIREHCRTNGPFSREDVANVRRLIESQYAKAKGTANFQAFEKAMTQQGVAREFSENFTEECQVETYFRLACSNQYVIADYVLTNYYNMVESHNKLAEKTNAAIEKRSRDVLARLEKGENFGDLADEFSMDPEKPLHGEQEPCTDDDLASEPEVKAVLDKLQVNEYSNVIKTEDSLQIVKLLERIPAEKSNSRQPMIRYARIYFRVAMIIQPGSTDEATALLEENRRQNLIKALMDKGLKNVKIEFPHGTKVISTRGAEGMLKRVLQAQGKTEKPQNVQKKKEKKQ